jgi:hypothetical protein
MRAESTALIPECAECEIPWLPADEDRWQAYTPTTSRRSWRSTARPALSGSSVATKPGARPGLAAKEGLVKRRLTAVAMSEGGYRAQARMRSSRKVPQEL